MEQVTREDVAHVAMLAHLDLADAEIDRLQRELNRILEHFAQLETLDTDGVEPMSHAVPMVNVLREDVTKDSLPIDEIVANAPDRADEFFRVPRIVES